MELGHIIIMVIFIFFAIIFVIGMILSIIKSFTEEIYNIRLTWNTFTKKDQSSYLKLKRIKFFDYYYIEEVDKYKTCKQHPDYEDSIKYLMDKKVENKKENLHKLW